MIYIDIFYDLKACNKNNHEKSPYILIQYNKQKSKKTNDYKQEPPPMAEIQ